MTASRTHSAKRTLGVAIASFLALLTSAVAVDAARPAGSPEGCSGTFGWPVKPFERPHQIRGAFGDPRTQFDGPPTLDTVDIAGHRDVRRLRFTVVNDAGA